MYCQYVTEGCEAKDLTLQTKLKHEGDCQYRPVQCPYALHGCTVKLPQKSINQHVEAECLFVPTKCVNDGCSQVVPRGAFEQHFQECVHATVQCVHKDRGCEAVVKRLDMGRHLAEDCLYELARCSNTPCHVELIRKDMPKHMEDCLCRPIACPRGCGREILFRDVEAHNCVRTLREDMFRMHQSFRDQVVAEITHLKKALLRLQAAQMQATEQQLQQLRIQPAQAPSMEANTRNHLLESSGTPQWGAPVPLSSPPRQATSAFQANSPAGATGPNISSEGTEARDRRKARPRRKCIKCGKFFSFSNNDSAACRWHSGSYAFGSGWSCCNGNEPCTAGRHEAKRLSGDFTANSV